MTAEKKPTIEELEEILNKPDGTYQVEILPNGEVRATAHCCEEETQEARLANDADWRAKVDHQKQRVKELLGLMDIFVRKGKYHMEQWPDDKEMGAALERARHLLHEVNDGSD